MNPPRTTASTTAPVPLEPGRSREGDALGDVVIIGAGPAGLTAAHRLAAQGATAVVFESDDIVGGISRTPERDGWRFDIGGHRFFTKVPEVEALWHEILPDDLMTRPRLSRIYYQGKFYDYPIRPANALANLGPWEAVRCVASFLWARVARRRAPVTLEDYIVANYGRRLFEHFFATYNEKVWGVPASALSADWGSQRIKGMSLWGAVWEPLRRRLLGARGNGNQVTSLIEEFTYPRLGPGQLWERCHELVEAAGTPVQLESPVVAVHRDGDGAVSVVVEHDDRRRAHHADHIISSMPINHLIEAMDPPAPDPVRNAAAGLRHRDFLTVALVVPDHVGFPDNWIYIHSPDVRVGRIQNFGAWSPHMVRDGRTCLGLEYFVSIGDDVWNADDEELIARARRELAALDLAAEGDVQDGWVVRMPRAYPVYDADYEANVEVIRQWLTAAVPNVHPVGRNGMHRYNNQDHSMYTAMLTVDNLFGADHDIWAVNVEADYHESGSGRAAPVLPRA